MKRILLVLLMLAMAFSLYANGGAEKGDGEVVELTATLLPKYEIGVTQQLDNPDNVVSPYLTEKFGIKISEIQKVPDDMTYPQAVVMWKAAGMAPDLMQCGAEDFGAMISSGSFQPLDPYLEGMPNYEKYLPRKYWSRELGEDGKVYAFYNLLGYTWPKAEPARDNVVDNSLNHRALWVREDVLKAIGYEFTPVMELKKETVDKGIRPTVQQLEINPPIETPEDFLEMLRKIKKANLKAIDGSPVIPFSMVWWETWHLGVMYDWGYWRINRDGEVDGYLGLPGAKEYMKWLWTAYREGLIDPDYLVHKSVQLQEKVATGKVAAGEYVPDALGTFNQLEKNVPGAVRHFFPFPKMDEEKGFYDPYNPHPYHRTLLNKNLDESTVKKIAAFVDWCYTDEGADLLSWGPEAAGLYTTKNGKKVFADPTLEKGVLEGAVEGECVYKYGLYDPVIEMSSDPLANALGPQILHHNVFHEYNKVRNYMSLIGSIIGSDPKNIGVSTQLQVANSDQSETVQEVADWYWGIFSQTYLPQVLKAKDEAEFEEKYNLMIDAFMRETNYKDAKANMEAYFKKFPPMFK